MGEALSRLASNGDEFGTAVTLELLSTMLAAYSLNARRTQLTWGEDSLSRLTATGATWGRATASGGGMYPAEAYVVMGPGSQMLPGVYHHNTAFHCLERLSVGDVTASIRLAVDDKRMSAANCFIVATARFWKSSFKYNNFTYHVATQDLGALLGSWRLLLSAAGVIPYTCLWFNERLIDEVLEIDTVEESSFVVVGLTFPHAKPIARSGDRTPGPAAPIRVRRSALRSWERSQTIRRFPEIEAVHEAGLVGPAPRPLPPVERKDSEEGPETQRIACPPSRLLLDAAVLDCFRERRSSFGLFMAPPALELEDLGSVLWASSMAAKPASDIRLTVDAKPKTRLWLIVNSVRGVLPGAYRYEATRKELIRVSEFDAATLLQSNYALTNYNMDQVGAALVITGFLDDALTTYGDRGYRMLNFEVGAAAQTAYLAASALHIGCGAVLGLDNIAIDEALGITSSGENSLLFVLLGNERPGAASFKHALPASGLTTQTGSAQEMGTC
jgi:SagB-type dehydrogenase family enzyme